VEMEPIVLYAPLTGWLMPIKAIPDPVFSEKMLGDGVGIDPLCSKLTAPCNGVITQILDYGHVVNMRVASNVEVLMHIGLDTSVLCGEGFECKCRIGDVVHQGDVLTCFDSDYLALNARSLISAIVITGSNFMKSITTTRRGLVEQNITEIISVSNHEDVAIWGSQHPDDIENNIYTLCDSIILPINSPALHAGSASNLVQDASKFSSEVTLYCHGQEVNARSMSAVMSLNTHLGDSIEIRVKGSDAKEALASISKVIELVLCEDAICESDKHNKGQFQEVVLPIGGIGNKFDGYTGLPAVSGIVIGNAYLSLKPEISVEAYVSSEVNIQEEKAKLERALQATLDEIINYEKLLKRRDKRDMAELLVGQKALLEDPEIKDATLAIIVSGNTASYSWKTIVNEQVDRIRLLDNPQLSERVVDLKNTGYRVLQKLCGVHYKCNVMPDNAVVFIDELAPFDILMFDQDKVVGLCAFQGGATSHAAILASHLSLPMLICPSRIVDIEDGACVILDADQGVVHTRPSKGLLNSYRSKIDRYNLERAQHLSHAKEPAITRDGKRIKICANIGSVKDLKDMELCGCEGVGLLRSEFLFLDRLSEPSENEQTEGYRIIVDALGENGDLNIRTLDVGGDKHIPYLPIPPEDNPHLGERGVRLSIQRPSILRRQLRAIFAATASCNLSIILPMVSRLDEYRTVRRVINEEQDRAGFSSLRVGVMVEIPSVALLADKFAKEVDFFSIGTNDLTQYTLAIDRGHQRLSTFADCLDPSVIKLIIMTIKAAVRYGKDVSVCGAMASDELAIPILIGLGIDELSVDMSVIPIIKASIRKLSLNTCQEIALKSLQMDSAIEIRRSVAEAVHL